MSAFTASEISNGIWFFMNLFCLMTFGYLVYVCCTVNTGKMNVDALRQMLSKREYDRELQAALALTIYFFGATVRGAYNWTLLMFSIAPSEGGDFWWVKFGAAACAVVGGLCILRVFTALRWGHRVWITAGLIAIIIPFLMQFTD